MGFTKRFGGWRPVQMEEGIGRLHSAAGETLDGVEYRFEVWHQMVDGFPGPYRCEGRVLAPPSDDLERFAKGVAVLVLEDGRRLEARIDAEGGLLAHQRPAPESADSVAAGAGPAPPVPSSEIG